MSRDQIKKNIHDIQKTLVEFALKHNNQSSQIDEMTYHEEFNHLLQKLRNEREKLNSCD